jgi:predicted AlkP superfamily phosphohydrolase/phosphomutase
MTKNAKTVIIGLDGVPFGMISDFAETGVMPNTAELISQGIFKKMSSSIPEVSSVAWSSIITGKNPGQHGIFGFTDLAPDSYQLRFPNFYDLKSPPLWDLANGKSIIINVPSTYPVRDMNGVHISGFVSIDIRKSVHPASLIPKLKELDYRLDVDSQKAHEDLGLFMEDLDRTLSARIKTYKYLWHYNDWQVFMFVFTGTDRLMHFLWSAYEDENHQYHMDFLEHFRKIDEAIGQLNERISDDDTLILLSDHGFERLDKDIYINRFLMTEGFLTLRQDNEPNLADIDYPTEAFALDPARIYLNLKGKFPCGTVDQSDSENLLCQLENLFRSLEIDGKKVIRDIYRKEQLYSGPYLENAPDLVLVGAKGFNLKASFKANRLTDKAIFSGKHTQDSAFLIVKGLADKSIVPEMPAVWNIKGIVEKS